MNKSYLIGVALVAVANSGLANPKGAQVTNGAITITETSGVMTINQTTPRGIIHWQDFSIGAGELTQFQHLDARSATLNRVVGGIPSSIHGTLSANGQVFLVNPNGILVGPTGRIDTAAFVASTLDVPDSQFMAGGNMRFSGSSPAGVVNLGSISASDGDVILMARNVVNAGTISAPNGTVALAAGNDIILQAAGDERVVVVSGTPGGGTGVENSGSIDAARAELKAAGGNVYALAINNTGVVKATGIAQQDGRIILSSEGGVVQNSGRLSVKNADGSGGSVKMSSGKGGTTINSGSIDASADNPKKNGGTVELTGDTVTVGNGSTINVSGATAGTVAIGISADIANQTTATGGIATTASGSTTAAQQATIQANSLILANSTSAGNGGRIVVWSETATKVDGTLEAKGGELGGDGGLIETSGRTGLTIISGTKVNTGAPSGKAGNWLLDPAGITIDAGPTDTTTSFTQNTATNHVAAADILTALSSGNVTVTTTGAFAPNTDIVVNAPIAIPVALGGAHTLTFASAGGIDINAAIGGAGSDVLFQAQSQSTININAGGSLRMNGVTLFANSGDLNIADQITAQSNKNIFLNAPNGSISFTGAGKANASGTGTVFLDTHLSDFGLITGAGPAAVISAPNLDIWSGRKGVSSGGSPLATAVDNLTVTVASTPVSGGGGVFIKNTSGGTLHIGGTNFLNGQPTAGILVPNLSGWLGVELSNTAGNIRLDGLAIATRITAWDNIKLTTIGSGDIQVLNTGNNSIRSRNGSVTLPAAGNVLIGDAGTSVGGVNVLGYTSTTVNATGDVTVAGSRLKAGGTSGLTVTAGGDINILTAASQDGSIGTSGGATINLTTGAGKTLNNNTTSSGGITTLLPDDLTLAITSTGANIFINTDNITLNSPIFADAGTGGGAGTLAIAPVTGSRSVDLGTKSLSKLSMTSNEVNQLHADTVIIGSYLGSGSFVVSDFISNPPGITNLELDSGGNIGINKPVSLTTGELTLNSTGGAITSTAAMHAGNMFFISHGTIDSSAAPIVANYIVFNSDANVLLNNAGNSIGAINSGPFDVSSGTQINVVDSSALAINGQLGIGGFTTSVYLAPGGNLFLNPSSKILANQVDLNLSHGGLLNSAGANALGGPSAHYRVWMADLFGTYDLGGLPGTQNTSSAVSHPNDPLAPDPRVFYFASITSPTLPASSGGTGRKLLALPGKNDVQITIGSQFKDILASSDPLKQLNSLSLEDLLNLNALIQNLRLQFGDSVGNLILSSAGITADVIAAVERLSRERAVAENLKQVQEERERLAREQQAQIAAARTADIKNFEARLATVTNWDDLVVLEAWAESDPNLQGTAQARTLQTMIRENEQQRLDALAGILGYDFPQSWMDALTAPKPMSPPAATSDLGTYLMQKSVYDHSPHTSTGLALSLPAYSLTPQQISRLDKSEVLLLLQASGVQLSPADSKLAASATMTTNTLKAVFQSGPVDDRTMATLLVLGADKLTASQIVSAGAGNIVSRDGAGVVSAGAGNVVSAGAGNVVAAGAGNVVSAGAGNVVSAGAGNVVSAGAGNAIAVALNKLVAEGKGDQPVAKILTQDGGGLLTQDGGGLLTQDGGGLLTQDGGGMLARAMSGILTQDGGGLLAKALAGMITQDGGGIVSHNGSALINQDGAGAVQIRGSGLSNPAMNGSGLINQDGAGLINQDGSGLINQDGAGLRRP